MTGLGSELIARIERGTALSELSSIEINNICHVLRLSEYQTNLIASQPRTNVSVDEVIPLLCRTDGNVDLDAQQVRDLATYLNEQYRK